MLPQPIMDIPADPLGHGHRAEAIHLAAQVMADAFRCFMGIPPQKLNELDEQTRIFYLQTARNVVKKYEQVVQDEREPVRDLRLLDGGKAGLALTWTVVPDVLEMSVSTEQQRECSDRLSALVEQFGRDAVERCYRLEMAANGYVVRVLSEKEAE